MLIKGPKQQKMQRQMYRFQVFAIHGQMFLYKANYE